MWTAESWALLAHLRAELVAFEVMHSPSPKVRVQVVIAWEDALSGKLSRTFTVEQAVHSRIPSDAADAEVEALGIALQM
ncbi:MAG TPA: hypothetical protein VFN67_14800 [Polyangiales bacterium]|nr:hypothetical protein [Polyangiales bacterium]